MVSGVIKLFYYIKKTVLQLAFSFQKIIGLCLKQHSVIEHHCWNCTTGFVYVLIRSIEDFLPDKKLSTEVLKRSESSDLNAVVQVHASSFKQWQPERQQIISSYEYVAFTF